MIKTHSFENCTLSITHPDVGTYPMYGAGLGQVQVSRESEITMHDVSADLSVLISRSAKKNGMLMVTVLQASEANDFLNRLCNYLETCNVERFARGTAVLESASTGETWRCKGVTHQKMPDRSYDARGGMVQYTFMVAELTLQQ